MSDKDATDGPTNLASVNLNLMVALEALLDEGHVGRAARRVGVTQSAMSQSLRQLRDLYGDALLARGRNGMSVTPRGQYIAAGLRRGLSELRATLDAPEFDAAASTRVFTLGVSDAVALAIVPGLSRAFSQMAPSACLDVQALERHPHLRAQQLEHGRVDLVLGADLDSAPGLRRQQLYEGGFIGLAAANNDRVTSRPSLTEYAAYSHVVYSPAAFGGHTGFIAQALAERGLRRHVALKTSYLLLAALVVAETDRVLLVRKHIAPPLMERFLLKTFAVPAPTPMATYDMLWHERFDQDPGHVWLRAQLKRIVR